MFCILAFFNYFSTTIVNGRHRLIGARQSRVTLKSAGKLGKFVKIVNFNSKELLAIVNVAGHILFLRAVNSILYQILYQRN